jgi:spermidine synthase
MAKSPRMAKHGRLKRDASRSPQLGHVPLGSTVFITGMAIMVLELVGSRVIGPYYGVSLYVWASLIATAMVALAAGYWIGGRIADRKAHPDYLYGSILLAALLTVMIPVLRRPILGLTSPLGVRLGSLSSAVLLFLLPITALGVVSPYAVRLYARALETVGSSAGTLYAVSTVGSVFGTLLTGFVLIPSLAMDKTLYYLGAVLSLPVAIYWFTRKRYAPATLSVVLALGSVAMASIPQKPPPELARMGIRLLYQKETPYGQLKVIDVAGARYMLVNGTYQGEVELASGRSRAGYAQVIAASCARYTPRAERALVIGLGAGCLPTMLQELGLTVDVVEIDGTVIDVAQQFFPYRPAGGRVVRADGRYYLERSDESYDLIFLDAFASEAVPAHLLSIEVFERCAEMLRANGLLAVNLIGFRTGPDKRAPVAVLRTLRSVFPHTLIWWIPQLGGRGDFGNVILLASRIELPPFRLPTDTALFDGVPHHTAAGITLLHWEQPGEGPVVTDRFNPLASWNTPADLRIREEVLRYVPPALLLG